MTLSRILLTWLAMAIAMSANGILRELVLERHLTESTAGWVSLGLGLAIILLITSIGFRGTPAHYPTASLLAVGAFLVGLTIAFEFAVGIMVDKKSLGELAAAYAFWRGETWPLVLLVLGLTPLMWRSKA